MKRPIVCIWIVGKRIRNPVELVKWMTQFAKHLGTAAAWATVESREEE